MCSSIYTARHPDDDDSYLIFAALFYSIDSGKIDTVVLKEIERSHVPVPASSAHPSPLNAALPYIAVIIYVVAATLLLLNYGSSSERLVPERRPIPFFHRHDGCRDVDTRLQSPYDAGNFAPRQPSIPSPLSPDLPTNPWESTAKWIERTEMDSLPEASAHFAGLALTTIHPLAFAAFL